MDTITVLRSVLPVFLVIAAGFFLRRIGWLTQEADQSILKMNYQFLYPCLIASTILGNEHLARAEAVLIPPLIGFVTVAGGYGLCALMARLIRLDWPQPGRTFAFSAGCFNYGFLPIPIIQAFYNDRATMGFLFTFTLGVEIAIWSVGVWLLSGTPFRQFWRKAINVPICAIAASAVLNLLGAGAWLPQFTQQAMKILGQPAIPLALILSGAMLADIVRSMRFAEGLKAVIAANVMRALILPPIMLAIAALVSGPVELRRVLAIEAAMPAAMIPIVLARYYSADTGTAIRIVLSSTVLGLLTIPIWLRIGFAWLHLNLPPIIPHP